MHLSKRELLRESRALAPVYRLYRRQKIRHLVRVFPCHIVTHHYAGYELSLSLEDPLAEGWYDRDWPGLPELDLLSTSLLTPGARVFDLGAHQCVIAMVLARIVGDQGSVVAVEAERHNHAVAGRNVALNAITNIEVLHAAATATEEPVRFAEGLNGRVVDGDSAVSSRVPGVTVDGLARRYGKPDVVFIDVEGHELEVLHGAARCLAAAETDFFVEVHIGHGLEKRGASVADILESFPDRRFRRFVSPASDQLDHYKFVPLDVTRPPRDRAFLVALANGRNG
jgi:FkbM family methyltransferase